MRLAALRPHCNITFYIQVLNSIVASLLENYILPQSKLKSDFHQCLHLRYCDNATNQHISSPAFVRGDDQADDASYITDCDFYFKVAVAS